MVGAYLKRLTASCSLMFALLRAHGRYCLAETLEERLASCLACHGEHGTSAYPEVPSLGRQAAGYMEIQLYLFREGIRRVEVMNETMRGVADGDLGVIARHLASLPAPTPPQTADDAARLERGRALSHQNHCDSCHLRDLSGQNNVPRIAGQREDYLLKALRGYKDNTRPGYDASMADVVQPLTDDDIRDLAYFAARQP
jgi:cytochrome c553